jgi:hypothetical protein
VQYLALGRHHAIISLPHRVSISATSRLLVQDWDGMLGLVLPVDNDFPRRLARSVMMNTSIPPGRVLSLARAGADDV